MIADGVLLSGVIHDAEPFEPIADNLKVERDGTVVPTVPGRADPLTNLKGRGLVS